MKTIYKYKLNSDGTTEPLMPHYAVVKHVAYQQQVLTVWAEVEIDNPPMTKFRSHIVVRGTGHPIGETGNHLATVPDPNGFHIWHIYEIEG